MTKIDYYRLLEAKCAEGKLPAINEHGSCKYRTEDGRACAVGLLIPDEKYDPSFEGAACYTPWSDTGKEIQAAVTLPDGVRWLDMRKIQVSHDEYARAAFPTGTPFDAAAFLADVRHILGIAGDLP